MEDWRAMSLRADRRQVQLAPAAGRRGTRAATRIWPDASYPHASLVPGGLPAVTTSLDYDSRMLAGTMTAALTLALLDLPGSPTDGCAGPASLPGGAVPDRGLTGFFGIFGDFSRSVPIASWPQWPSDLFWVPG